MATATKTKTRTKLRKNDVVQVLGGKDRGKQGRILRVLSDKGRAIVEQVNMVKHHERANPNRNIKGGILEKEAPIHLSKLALVCGNCRRPTRIRMKSEGEAAVRSCAHCGAALS